MRIFCCYIKCPLLHKISNLRVNHINKKTAIKIHIYLLHNYISHIASRGKSHSVVCKMNYFKPVRTSIHIFNINLNRFNLLIIMSSICGWRLIISNTLFWNDVIHATWIGFELTYGKSNTVLNFISVINLIWGLWIIPIVTWS